MVESQPHASKQEPGHQVEGAEEEDDEVPPCVDHRREEIADVPRPVIGGHVEVLDQGAATGPLYQPASRGVDADGQLSCGGYEIDEVCNCSLGGGGGKGR